MKTTTITGGGLATGGGDLSSNRVISVTEASQAEAEGGTVTDKVMTPLRSAQHLAAAGWGGTPPTVADAGALNAIARSCIVKCTTPAAPTVGAPAGAGGGICVTHYFGAANIAQTYREVTGTGRIWHRTYAAGAWGAWDQAVTVGILARSFGNNGYQTLPGGLILQWGRTTMGTAAGFKTVTQALPITFPNAAYCVIAQDNADGVPQSIGAEFASLGSLTLQCEDTGVVYWIAIGN